MDDEDLCKDTMLPEVTSWSDPVTGKTHHGIQLNVGMSIDCKRHEFDHCPICLKLYTVHKKHQTCCLPCGHIFGMSCLREWMEDSDKLSIRRFSFSKKGFAAFKQYEQILRTNALNNRSASLKQRADVLGQQNDAMIRWTGLLKQMDDAEKRTDVLERETELLNHEEEWAEASEQQDGAEKRAEVLRCRADALGQWADEYLQKADAFGQQAEALRQQAKSLSQLVHSYLASRKFYIQSYKEFLGLHDNKITE